MKRILSVPVSVVRVIPLAILLLIAVALAGGTAIGTTTDCSNTVALC